MTLRLIGFAGRAGSGKSWAAFALVLRQPRFARMRFADPLKAMLLALGATEAEIDGLAKETPSPHLCGKTPRHAMQTLGTEWGRQMIGISLWVDAWARRADALLADGGSVVVDDVRFPDEIEAIRARGGRIYWIERGPVAPPTHASEALGPDACDGVIVNTFDEGFEASIARAVAGLR